MKIIDGSRGEGGGQILRSSMALAILTRTPIQIVNIRAKRSKPGLMRQHLTAVRAAAEICGGTLSGDRLGAREIVFEPGDVRPGDYTFTIGTAGSVGLVFQTVLYPLLLADGPSRLTLEGGTHNKQAPPYDFLVKTFLPLLAKMGGDVEVTLDKPGFYPAGGGRYHVAIRPSKLGPLELMERGEVGDVRVRALVANLPLSIAKRELGVVQKVLGLDRGQTHLEEVEGSDGPGNVVFVELAAEHVTEVASAYGERGVRAEAVAKKVAKEAKRYLENGAPVGEHLADQLLLPLALGAGGVFVSGPLSEHSLTNIETIRMFLDVDIQTRPVGDRVEVRVMPG
ncbi:MAG: RNA 3'-terminal phosphate cyclase [Deltaproteobacteria bacterium]|jgi:RNA 3'-terminal phosphate cyclase (ATP)